MTFNKAQIESGLLKNLTVAANHFKEIMFKKIDEVRAPKNIKTHTSVGSVQKKGNQMSIDISIDISKEAAPEAPAYEWGSGEHATRGNVGRYKIEGNPLLAIPRSRWPDYNPPPDIDPVVLPYVLHPGVAPRPYIAPSIQESTPKIKEILGRGFKASILVGVPKVEVISAKK
jgi:hypothetical protein